MEMEEEMYFEEQEWRQKFEGALPLILLILIVGVILWKTSLIYSIPGIGDLLRPKVVKILIIGYDPSIETMLDSMKTELPLTITRWGDEDIKLTISPDKLKGYDIIIITENIGKEGELPASFMNLLKSYLETSSPKLFLYGLAASRMEEGGVIYSGWAMLKDFIPMECRVSICDESQKEPYSTDQVVLIKREDHPALKGFDVTYFEGDYVEVVKVNPSSGAWSLMIMMDNRTGASQDVILEKSYGFGGKAVYFAFHPSNQPYIFKSIIRYLAGR